MSNITTRLGHRLASIVLVTTLATGCQPAAIDAGPTFDSSDSSETVSPTALVRLTDLRAELAQADQDDQRHRITQMIAFAEAELGRYLEAERSFPFPPQRVRVDLPDTTSHRAIDAIDGIAALARDRQLVMINEAHHLARHRTLTTALLPRLRELGFTHFAAEALDSDDPDLTERGYVRSDSTSSYLREPRYGELIRQALALGFVVVPYESDSSDLETREAGQARNLFEAVFAKNPNARLVVHAGFAHIDEAPSRRLWNIEPLAMRLKALTGIDPLTVEQTLFAANRSQDTAVTEPVDLAERFGLSRPGILLANADDSAWRIHPDLHDVNVLWPADTGSGGPRPAWLALDGQAVPWPVDPILCAGRFPCLVEATLASEPAEAVAIDRYAFFAGSDPEVPLWLPPGRYRVVARDQNGVPLGEERMTLDQLPPARQ